MTSVKPPGDRSCTISSQPVASCLVFLLLLTLSAGCCRLGECRYDLARTNKAELLRSFPHDSSAFTQGLAWDDGVIIESTGLKGASSLRKVHLKTGEVLQKRTFPADIFAEGATVFQDKIFLLTWQNNRIYVYDKDDLSLLSSHHFPKEGWGITHDDTHLIVSDGSEYLYFLDPVTMKETRRIAVHCISGRVRYLNELEYVEGMIVANIWKHDLIAVIDPENGVVADWLDLSALRNNLPEAEEHVVFNGVAYDQHNKRLFVTGKNSSLIFEIGSFLQLDQPKFYTE